MTSDHRPSVIILAGPNGAGKSTAASSLLQGTLGVDEFVNADDIARELSPGDVDRVAIAAGRVMLTRLRQLAGKRVSFAFETTLASRSFAPWIEDLRRDGYSVHILFLWLPSAEFAIERVAHRRAQLLPPVRAARVELENVRRLRRRAEVDRGTFGHPANEGLR